MSTATRAEAYAALDSERAYQEMRKQRDQGSEHSVDEFLLYVIEYTDQARHIAATTWGPDAKLKTLAALRKVGGLVVAAMEAHGAPQREGFEQPVA